MTKIQIYPKWRDVKPSDCYVYIHRKVSNDEIFYVGKGTGRRGWGVSPSYRPNPKWQNFARKHGVIIQICQDGMDEESAHLLEMWLIAKLRHEGIDLCNMTDGGEGVSGFRWSQEQKESMSSPVRCSNGMSFKSQTAAVEWLLSIGYTKACKEGVSACCRGDKGSAYGFSWWYEEDDPKEYISKGDRISEYRKVPVLCSSGMRFDSTKSAVDWLALSGIYAHGGNIANCCKGKFHMAYGYSWWYENAEPKEEKKKGWWAIGRNNKILLRSDGNTYESVSAALDDLRLNGWPKARQGNLCSAARGEREFAYGYGWKYV